jgi:hypothetical protein
VNSNVRYSVGEEIVACCTVVDVLSDHSRPVTVGRLGDPGLTVPVHACSSCFQRGEAESGEAFMVGELLQVVRNLSCSTLNPLDTVDVLFLVDVPSRCGKLKVRTNVRHVELLLEIRVSTHEGAFHPSEHSVGLGCKIVGMSTPFRVRGNCDTQVTFGIRGRD